VASPRDAIEAVLDAMGATEAAPESPAAMVVRQGATAALGGKHVIETEDGGTLLTDDRLPADLPPGYHRLRPAGGGPERRLIISPGVCPLDESRRLWGWTVQLYALRSRRSWGMGDLGDLARLGRWSRRLGAGFLLVNPMHAALPGTPQQPSPYYPSSRRFRNPLYVRVEEVPGAEALDLSMPGRRGRALNRSPRVDRDAIHDLKLEALENIWRSDPPRRGFDAYRRREGEALESYATFCAVTEVHGRPWQSWPPELRHPESGAVRSFRRGHAERVRFHQWLQWLVELQLQEASRELPLIHDLAAGFDWGGADAWLSQDVLAAGISIGAPPDRFNTKGQDWGLAPYDPWRLRQTAYEPFVQTVRSALQHAGGIRVDHVLGLFRQYWIPQGRSPAEGAYVRYPAGDLLDILALEATRAGAVVVGEDLGTVERGVRRVLAQHNVLSYRVFWFEDRPPREYPVKAMAAVTTHDLPTLAGAWTGADAAAQREIGLEPPKAADALLRRRIRRFAGVAPGAALSDVADRVHAALARAPSILVGATLEDVMEVETRPNMPGTTNQWPNWSIPLPEPLETLERDPRPRRIARRLSGA
jgi:4-alpha-glucanotransferase